MIPLIIVGVLLAVTVIGAIVTYNSFVSLRNDADEALSDIDVQLKRRHDLIPNLIETVKGYATHERELFQRITEARANAMQTSAGSNPAAAAQAEGMLGGLLGNLMAVAEAYPDLKASTNFLELQRELAATEDKIAAARRYYNTTVRTFNTKLQQFPTNIIGNATGFTAREFFEIDEETERAVPEFSFGADGSGGAPASPGAGPAPSGAAPASDRPGGATPPVVPPGDPTGL